MDSKADPRYVVFDCETTGLDPAKDGILTIGAVAVRCGEICLDDEFDAILSDWRMTSAVLVHGIIQAEAATGETEEQAVNKFLDYVGDAVLDTRSEHLHGHSSPIAGRGLVDDRDGRPTDRRLGEAPEGLVERHAEVAFDDATNLVERHGRARVETRAELVRDGITEHARRRTDQLSELHERRAEVLERAAERTGPRVGRNTSGYRGTGPLSHSPIPREQSHNPNPSSP